KQIPAGFRKQIIARPVVVKLDSGVGHQGFLAWLDGYVQGTLEQAAEYEHGRLKNDCGMHLSEEAMYLYTSTRKRSIQTPRKRFF
ncbi:U6 snRNA-associated Sm-like protein LSm6, partial [Fukomys damarensis]